MEMVIEDAEMSNTITVGGKPNTGKTTQDLEEGQFGVVTDKVYHGHIVFRIFQGFASLTGESWDSGCILEVYILQPGEVITIEIGD